MDAALPAARLRLLPVLLLLILALVPPSCSLSTHAPRPSVDDSRSAITFLSPPSVPTPAGLLFVATLDGQLHALDVQSGQHQWSFGTGESLLRSTPATSVTSAPHPAPPLTSFDPFAVMDGEAEDGEEDESGGSGAEADNVIIPGVDGQLFFSTRQGQLERLPVTVSDLVTASPFRSSDERMYVGRKSSAFIQLNRTTGEVKRVLNEYGEQLHTGAAEGEGDDRQQQQQLDDEDAELLWVDRQDLSVHAFHSRHGRRWNVSLSEYFVHIGGAEKAAWSEERLVSIGIPHLAATVDGELVAINVADRERYQWRHAFSSPISSVHFSRSPSSPASPASLLDSLLPPHQLLKLPVYYLPPAAAAGGSASVVSQYLWLRMKALRTKTVDTYVGQTADGVLYALPNPPSSGSDVLPVEEDNLLIYQPPAEPSSSSGLVPVSSSSRPACSASHPFYPLCMVGFHSVPEADPVRDGQYLPLPWHPVPAVRNISRESEHQPYTAGKDAMDTGGGATEGAVGWAGSWWASVVTSAVVSACMSAPLLVAMWFMHVRNNSSKKRRRRDRQPEAAAGREEKERDEEKQDRSWAKDEVKREEKAADEAEDVDESERGDSDDEEKQGVKTEDEEKKEIVVKPPSQPTFLLPAAAAARNGSNSSSSSSSSSSPSAASSPSLPSPTNSDGSLAIPSTGLSSVLSSMSQVYTIGKIQIFADQVLGTGNQGTIVYAGLHETRECAVKRLVKPFFGHENADKEISLLIQSDQHSCVLRYYAKEEDASFIYIALEKCAGSLQDLVKEPQRFPGAEPRRILHDMLLGLAHLHAINIVHRDIKPQNILLSLHRAVYRSKLADMGLGKKLDHARSSFANSVFSRSEGWQPPEVLMVAGGGGGEAEHSASPAGGARLTKAVDVFSAGCVVYYVLTGHHPFGVLREQEMNIVAGRASYSHLREHRAEAEELISSMLSPLPDERLSANDCCHHPLFWSDEQKLHFLLDVSDRVEAEPEHSECRLTLERFAGVVFPSSAPWDGLLHRGLLDSLHKFRKYDFCSVRDLLRVIRNKRHHYRDLPEDVQRELGPVPSGFLLYFASRFPALLMACYRVMSCFCLEREGQEGGGSSVSGWEEVEAEERRGGGRSAIPLSAPLTDWPGVVLTTQLRLYYQHCSMKRLLQLQDAARLRYRVWSNEQEAWVQDSCNVNADCARERGGVRLVRGWSEQVARWAEESERRVKEEAKDERVAREREKKEEKTAATAAAAAPQQPVPSMSMFPPLSAAGPAVSSSAASVLSTSPSASSSMPPPPPPPSRASPPPASGTGWDNAAKRFNSSLAASVLSSSSSSPSSSASSAAAAAPSSRMLVLPKRPGIRTLSPMKPSSPAAAAETGGGEAGGAG